MNKGSSFVLKKRTLIAIACAGVFSAPLAGNAQTTYNYQDQDICGYGTCNMGFSGQGLTIQFSTSIGLSRDKSDGATAGDQVGVTGTGSNTTPRNQIWTGLSWIRFSGSRLIGGDFIKSTAFAVESGITMDSGATSVSAGSLGTRNTGLGIDTSIGSFWAGKWTTPYNSMTNQMNATTSSYGQGITNAGLMGNPGFGISTAYSGNSTTGFGSGAAGSSAAITSAMSFSRTAANTLHYLTPTFSGVQAHIGYTAAEETPVGANPVIRPELWSGNVTYRNGPLVLGIAAEQHNDYLWGTALGANQFGSNSAAPGAGTTSKDKGYKATAMYTIGNSNFFGTYEQLRYSQNGGAANVTSMQRNAWYVGIKQQLTGPHAVAASYSKAGSYSCTSNTAFDCSNTGVTFWTAMYTYSVDKYTKLMASYGRMSNDSRASYSSGGVSSITPTATAGAVTGVSAAGTTQQAYNIGIASSW